jgi:hypothetical protein
MFAIFTFSTLDDVWQFEVERNPDASQLLADASAADIERLKQQLASILDRYSEDGPHQARQVRTLRSLREIVVCQGRRLVGARRIGGCGHNDRS